MTPIRTEALIREGRIHPQGTKNNKLSGIKKKERKKQNRVCRLSVITVWRRADEKLRRDESCSEKCQRRARRDNGRGGQAEKRTAAIYLLLFPRHTPFKYIYIQRATSVFEVLRSRGSTRRRRSLQVTRPSVPKWRVRSALEALIEGNVLLNPGRRFLLSSSLSTSNFINHQYCCHPITITQPGLCLCKTGTHGDDVACDAVSAFLCLR